MQNIKAIVIALIIAVGISFGTADTVMAYSGHGKYSGCHGNYCGRGGHHGGYSGSYDSYGNHGGHHGGYSGSYDSYGNHGGNHGGYSGSYDSYDDD